ncbi:oligoribonuclease [Candidatus Saccharibacteria bacterium]|nr:MAG: oligoribonuclease [Candidatus Saccharibacteria bacterium]
MTGLDVDQNRILEVAVEVSDMQLRVLETYEAVIHQPKGVLDGMGDWARQQHAKSGLTQRVQAEGRPEAEVQAELVSLIRRHFDEPAVVAGNSIHRDRMFIAHWWPQVEQLLHYRMLDVSSFKVLMQGMYGLSFTKSENHRALDDIRESIAELQYYLEWLSGDRKKPEAG